MEKTAEELKQAKLALIEEINLRSPDELTGLWERSMDDLEGLRDTLPEKPDPDSDEYRARQARVEARKEPTTNGIAQDKPKGRTSYVVAAGEAVCTKRGIVADGAPIAASDLPGGKTAFGVLKDADVIVKA